MVDMNLVKLAVDTYNGTPEKYSVAEGNEALRNALIEINGGTELNYKKMRAGASNGMFELLEEIIPDTVVEGLQGDEFFNELVDFRNPKAGDEPAFTIDDANWFEISEVAPGSRGLRRQRVEGKTSITIPTKMHGVRIYEPLRRLLAGRVDFNQFIDDVAKSYRRSILDDIYTCWAGLTSAEMGSAYFPAAGTYNANTVLTVVDHVEAASGKPAIILGTAKVLRNLTPPVQGADSKSDIYNMGYYGKFYGTPMYKIPQRHAVGTTNFIFPDDVIHVIASGSKPIKMVYEGNSIIKLTDALDNADMTQEYEFYDMYGVGIAVGRNDGIGRIQLST